MMANPMDMYQMQMMMMGNQMPFPGQGMQMDGNMQGVMPMMFPQGAGGAPNQDPSQ